MFRKMFLALLVLISGCTLSHVQTPGGDRFSFGLKAGVDVDTQNLTPYRVEIVSVGDYEADTVPPYERELLKGYAYGDDIVLRATAYEGQKIVGVAFRVICGPYFTSSKVAWEITAEQLSMNPPSSVGGCGDRIPPNQWEYSWRPVSNNWGTYEGARIRVRAH